MKHAIELLAPGGDIKAVKAAILAGANAIYCGLNKFNARNRAANISFDDLQGILRVAHQNDCQVFITLNILILDSEIPAIIKLLNQLVNTSIDGVIVQDFGLFYLINTYFPSLKIHASTQLTTHNEGQLKFLSQLKAERVNLSRELNLTEIKYLTIVAHQEGMKTEVFVHGSYCISFSGLCYMSSLHGGNSGNRGQCSQPCRERYLNTPAGKEYPLNLKDNSAYHNFKELYDAGVDSLKIEGRIKEFEYVYTVVNAWRKQIDNYLDKGILSEDNSALYKVFNRDFSNGYLIGKLSKAMFIDNPMNHALTHLKQKNHHTTLEKEEKKQAFLEEKRELRTYLDKEMTRYDMTKQALTIHISGENGKPLIIHLRTPQDQFEIVSDVPLTSTGKEMLNKSILLKRLKAIDATEFFIQTLTVELHQDLYIPFSELTAIKKHILKTLNRGRHFISPMTLPKLKRQKKITLAPRLSVLISSLDDMSLLSDTSTTVYFQLPHSMGQNKTSYQSLFEHYPSLIPWFPSVLIGDDYTSAVEFLEYLKPPCIVCNNTGIAYAAYERNIKWIAGPELNITNSYSLQQLKEKLGCYGAFISNELSKLQILGIKAPEDFELHYIIYQPITLMTSRQCLSQQVGGCAKHQIDNSCISHCDREESIITLKDTVFIIEKSKGNYHRVLNETHLLNTEIMGDLGERFNSLSIDLSRIKNKTKIKANQKELIELFELHLRGDMDTTKELHTLISPTTNSQYQNGI